jgi:hypothetical protein
MSNSENTKVFHGSADLQELVGGGGFYTAGATIFAGSVLACVGFFVINLGTGTNISIFDSGQYALQVYGSGLSLLSMTGQLVFQLPVDSSIGIVSCSVSDHTVALVCGVCVCSKVGGSKCRV